MTRIRAKLLTGVVVLLIAGIVTCLIYSNQAGFRGSRVKNPDA